MIILVIVFLTIITFMVISACSVNGADAPRNSIEDYDAVNCLQIILDITVDYDGHRTVRGLNSLINEITDYASIALLNVRDEMKKSMNDGWTQIETDIKSIINMREEFTSVDECMQKIDEMADKTQSVIKDIISLRCE